MRKRLIRYIALICTVITLTSMGSVWAMWQYANNPATNENGNLSLNMNNFVYDIPTKVYLSAGKAKIEVALAKGKKDYDKRETDKQRDIKREMEKYKKWN